MCSPTTSGTGASRRCTAPSKVWGAQTAVHICYGYGIEANIRWKQTLGAEWRQYEEIFPALNASRIAQVSLECANSRVPLSLLGLLSDKEILLGAIDVAALQVETPDQVADVIRQALAYVDRRAHPALHQLRHGAVAAYGGDRQAKSVGRRRCAGPQGSRALTAQTSCSKPGAHPIAPVAAIWSTSLLRGLRPDTAAS